jgi:phosphate starvation-inducible membrane PsiE
MRRLLSYTINLLFVAGYAYAIWYYWNAEIILSTWRSIVVNYMCSGTHLFMYLHVIGITGLIRLVDILLY